MARKLAKNVHIRNEVYEAGTTPPKEIADQITNPKAWGEEPDDEGAADADGEKPKKRTARKSTS